MTMTDDDLRESLHRIARASGPATTTVDVARYRSHTRRRRAAGSLTAATLAAAVVGGALLLAPHLAPEQAPSVIAGSPRAHPAGGTESAAPSTLPPLPAPERLTESEARAAMRDLGCNAEIFETYEWVEDRIAATGKLDSGPVVVLQGRQRGVPTPMLCAPGIATPLGPGGKLAVDSATPDRPVRTIDVGRGWSQEDGVYTAVLWVLPSVTSVTVQADGGLPAPAVVFDGLAFATASGSKPPVELVPTPTDPRAGVVEGPLREATEIPVTLTAFDADGRVIFHERSETGRFGWVSATHPNR